MGVETVAGARIHRGPYCATWISSVPCARWRCSSRAVARFTGRAAALVGRWGDLARETLPPGMSFALDGGGALTLVRETGLPARFDDYAVAVGAMGATLR